MLLFFDMMTAWRLKMTAHHGWSSLNRRWRFGIIAICGLIMITSGFAPVIHAGESACIRGDCQNGEGTYIFYSYGMWYEGSFQDGLFHGQGVLTLPNGGSKSGFFQKGLYLGPQLEYWPEKRHTTGLPASFANQDSASTQKEAPQSPSIPGAVKQPAPMETDISGDLHDGTSILDKLNTIRDTKDKSPLN
ncbi:MAG: hypothetical protein HQK55_01360 [Deltaproteobacteria bacterium]|nr:hypothetical protein [Deltaproteobacteria bacterium]